MVSVCEIPMMICEITSVNATKLLEAAMIGCETTTLLRSHPIISSLFRRLALGIIPICDMPFWTSLFLLAHVAVLYVDVRSYHDKFRYGKITIQTYRI